MHFYPFNPAKYNLSTSHWSEDRAVVECEAGLLRDLAYRRLLDWYYGDEEPIPSKTRLVSIRIRMLKHEVIVASVLREKFSLVDGFWRQQVADAEITKYQKKVDTARKNGKLGGRPPKEKPSDNPAKPSGLQIRNRTRTINTPLPPEGELWWTEFWTAYPNKAKKPTALKAFAGALKRATSFQSIMDGLKRHITCEQWQRDATKIPHPSTWLNADQWNDEPVQAGTLNGDTKHWWDGRSGIMAKGLELGLPAPADDSAKAWYEFMAAVWLRAGPGPWLDDQSMAYPIYKRLAEGGE